MTAITFFPIRLIFWRSLVRFSESRSVVLKILAIFILYSNQITENHVLRQGYTKPGSRVARANKFSVVLSNISGSSACSLLHFTHLAHGVLRWFPDFCKICAPCSSRRHLCSEGSWFKSWPEDFSCFFLVPLGTFRDWTAISAVPWLGLLIAGFWPWRLRFNPTPVHMGFMADKVVLKQFYDYFGFPRSLSFHWCSIDFFTLCECCGSEDERVRVVNLRISSLL